MTRGDLSEAQAAVDAFLDAESLPTTTDYDCPYLANKQARLEGFMSETLDADIYQALMDRGFRRSGRLIHRPACQGCEACRPIRVPVAGFRPSRSQRRVWRRNQDLTVRLGRPAVTDRRWHMFVAYLNRQHDDTMSRSRKTLTDFLYESPVDTLEVCYRLGRKLIAISIVDWSDKSLSSVYTYFDPEFAGRSLGTYSALWEIEHCRQAGIPYYYLGYYVAGSAKMTYKARFGPCEIMDTSHRWRPFASENRT